MYAPLQNGVGAHILQCKKLDFHYCDNGGSSKYVLLGTLSSILS